MRKEAIVGFLILIIAFTSGCDKLNIIGKAVSDIDTTTTQPVDHITARYNRLINGIESETPLAKIDVDIVDLETNETLGDKTTTTTTSTTTTTRPAPTTTTTRPTANATTTTTIPALSDGVEVSFKNGQISPVEISIKPGQKVVWVNREKDRVHMVNSIYSQEFRSQRIMPGGRFEHVFNTAGTYKYIDSIHPEKIAGTITVS